MFGFVLFKKKTICVEFKSDNEQQQQQKKMSKVLFDILEMVEYDIEQVIQETYLNKNNFLFKYFFCLFTIQE